MSTPGKAPLCGGVIDEDGSRKQVAHIDTSTPDSKYLRHWSQGRLGIEYIPEGIKRYTTQGNAFSYHFLFRVYLEPQLPSGLVHEEVWMRLREVWQDERGWHRTGLRIGFTEDPNFAKCRVKIASAAGGNEGCNNCASCSCVHTRSGVPDRMYIHERHLGIDFILNHEMGHAAFSACDMYLKDSPHGGGGGYGGVMDVGLDATIWPTAHDIADCREWLRGRARFTRCG